MGVTKLPPLQCPRCKDTRVYTNKAGSIVCEECRKKFTKFGNVLTFHEDEDPYEESHPPREPEYDSFSPRFRLKK